MSSEWPYRFYREHGQQYVTRDKPVCDFCLTPWADEWTYPAAEMPIVGAPIIDGTDDDWAVCDKCHELLKNTKIGELVERMVELQPTNDPPNEWRRYPPKPLHRRLARENVMRFLDARKAAPYRGRPPHKP
jgi:hypothetical protein